MPMFIMKINDDEKEETEKMRKKEDVRSRTTRGQTLVQEETSETGKVGECIVWIIVNVLLNLVPYGYMGLDRNLILKIYIESVHISMHMSSAYTKMDVYMDECMYTNLFLFAFLPWGNRIITSPNTT